MAALALAAALVLASPPSARPGTGAPPQGGPGEGIKVHGDWTIEVKNPDGSLAWRHEFKNALVPTGKQFLALLLYGHNPAAPTWSIHVLDPICAQNISGEQVPISCRSAQPAFPWASAEQFNNLTLHFAASLEAIELRGSVTASFGGAITQVQTEFVHPAVGGIHVFSSKTIAPGRSVQAGQIVQLKVVFSFSSAS